MSDELLKRYKKSLEGLTVGGSEYYDEPERCARDIQRRLDSQNDTIRRLVLERRKIDSIPIIGWFIERFV